MLARAPSIESIKKAMQTYARQGGTSTIFINDDGLQLLSPGDRDARLAYYADHNFEWDARPKHEDIPDEFKRAGRFKEVSDIIYVLQVSLRLEKHLTELIEKEKEKKDKGKGKEKEKEKKAKKPKEKFTVTKVPIRIKVYQQGNAKATRKATAPLVKAILEAPPPAVDPPAEAKPEEAEAAAAPSTS